MVEKNKKGNKKPLPAPQVEFVTKSMDPTKKTIKRTK